jgi:c-di-GMP-binding flagellar brake protein YcgR
MIEERRRYIRLDTGLEFSYKIKGTRDAADTAFTKNISPGGICALIDTKIKKGDQLELNICIPMLEGPIFAIGKVIWTADEKAGKIDAGIKFEEIEPETKNKFLEYICQLMFSQLEKLRM